MGASAGQAVVRTLQRFGVDRVFGIPGVHTLEIYDALTDTAIDHVTGAHEGSTVRTATAAARIDYEPSVAIVSAGPGAINSMAGVAEARSLGVPLVVVAGAEPRRDGLHNVEDPLAITGMYRSIAKDCLLVEDPGDVPHALTRAFRTAQSGRPGPVVVQIPKDVLLTATEYDTPPVGLPGAIPLSPDTEGISAVAERVAAADAPVVVAGQGARRAGSDVVHALAERLDAPVVVTYRGFGAYAQSPRYAGMYSPGVSHAAAEAVLDGADLVIGLGVREGTRRQLAEAVVVDACYLVECVERYELGTAAVAGDLTATVDALEEMLPQVVHEWWRPRFKPESESSQGLSPFDAPHPGDRYQPREVVAAIDAELNDAAVVTVDVGIHASATLFHLDQTPSQTVLAPENWGAMGHAIPSAIGAKLTHPDRQVVAVEGDGSGLMNATEFTTAVANDLDLTVVVFDNEQHNAVYFDQHREYGRSSYTDVAELAFADFAESAGGTGFTVGPEDDLTGTVAAALSHCGPCIVSVATAGSVRFDSE